MTKRVIQGTALIAVAAFVSLIVMRFTLFAPFKVPSGSMWPSIEPGAHVFVNHLDKTPARGTPMVFEYPEHPQQLFIHRAIGLPGDELEWKGRILYINGWEVPHCFVARTGYTEAESGFKHDGDLEIEFLDDAAYFVFHDARALAADHQGPWRVKPGEYFVVGDNRENAHDSRMWFGGMGGGVPFARSYGRLRIDTHTPQAPPDQNALIGPIQKCLAARPPKTTPPSAK